MHIQEINIKNRVYNYYFVNLVKAKKLENKNHGGTDPTKNAQLRPDLILAIRS